MNHLLRPRIWPSFLASSGVGPYDVPSRYASEPIPRYRGTVARWHVHLRGLATAIHEISGLGQETGFFVLPSIHETSGLALFIKLRGEEFKLKSRYVLGCPDYS